MAALRGLLRFTGARTWEAAHWEPFPPSSGYEAPGHAPWDGARAWASRLPFRALTSAVTRFAEVYSAAEKMAATAPRSGAW